MNKKIFALLSIVFFAVSCNSVPQSGAAMGNLQQKYDSLAQVVAQMHEEFEIVKFGLERRGASMADMKAELDAERKVWDIPVGQSPVAGKADAPITIVEFSEFQCPYCARVAPMIEEIVKKYPNEVRLVYKHFPLTGHNNAPAAAAASIAAQNQGKFWEYRYALAPYYRELIPETFIKVAEEVGLDMEKFKKDMELTPEMQARIDEDFKLGASVGVNGTPNFYVNGRKSNRFSPELIDQMVADLRK
ncbi:MAG: thioredoxin domain-containing protein [Fibrobacter sp.]|nr:thioredoxin domain-containing protein [Fibrobacter sp.]